ncbi:MAG: hypothetical protein QOI63_2070 [Thermoplasmata archaeon]|jgi:hypothetical protein|nr:hypothetical protein [Thermoplasmata archaeon]
MPLRPLALALTLLVPMLAGCGAPAQPPTEIAGGTGLAFLDRPAGTVHGVQIVWDARVLNEDNQTSAPARLHLAVTSSRTGIHTDKSVDVARLPPHGTAAVQASTPYDGAGDYSGVAEILVGQTVVARAFIFYEQCLC